MPHWEVYRGYTLISTDFGEINIHDAEQCLIDSGRTVEEARKIIDEWQNAK